MRKLSDGEGGAVVSENTQAPFGFKAMLGQERRGPDGAATRFVMLAPLARPSRRRGAHSGVSIFRFYRLSFPSS
jgi:hypothetical protein